MRRKEAVFIFILFLIIAGVFFYKTIFFGLIPFPGDLLVFEYNPWRTYSYLGYNPGSFPNKAQYFDVLRQLYPWKTLSIDLFKKAEFPLWNPYNFSGAPLLANFQSAVFYPFNLLYLFLSRGISWTVLVFLQPFLASVFTYFYARKVTLGRIASLFAALSYGFSSFMTVWLEYNTVGHVILWLPLILLSVEKLLQKARIVWLLVFTFSVVSSLFGGHPQVFLYFFFFSLLYAFYRMWVLRKLKKANVLFVVLLFFSSLGIGAAQFLPGMELVSQSARAPHDYQFLVDKILIQPWQLVMLFVPDFFGNPATRNYWPADTYVGKVTSIGLISLFFVLFALWKSKNTFTTFFGFSSLTILLLTTSNILTKYLYMIEIPLISSSSPTLSIFIFCFSLSLLSGFGVDAWLKEKQSLKNVIYWVSPFLFLFLLLWAAVSFEWAQNIRVGMKNLLFSSLLLGVGVLLLGIGAMKKRWKHAVLIALLFFNLFDLFRLFERFNPFVPKELVFPQAPLFEFLRKEAGYNRFWGYGTAYIDANFATEYKLFAPDGYDPLYPRKYGEFIQSAREGKIETRFTTQNRSDAILVRGFGENDLSSNKHRLKVLDALGVRYILDKVENKSTDQTFPPDRFTLIHEDSGWRVFENRKASPRAFLTTRYQTFHTKEEFETIFFSESFDPAKEILLEEDVMTGPDPVAGSIEFVSYTSNVVTLRADANVDNLLSLSDTYYPGWKAFVDEEETKIYRANYAFRAIAVPSGSHTVVFRYEPQSFRQGLSLTVVSLLLFGCILVVRRKV